MVVIKQYGIERSGTNYIKALIELNSDAIVLSILFGGKHDKYFQITKEFDPFINKWVVTDLSEEKILQIKEEFLNENIYYLISIKNPYSWVVSYREYCKRHNFNINLSAGNLIELWNKYNLNWIGNLSSKNYYVVSYGKLMNDPANELENIFKKFGINANNHFIGINHSMVEGADVHGSKNISGNYFNHDYYLSGEYMSKLSELDIEVINKNSDKSVLSLLYL